MKEIEITFPDDCKKYVDLQCNNELSDYTQCPEVQPVLDTIAAARPQRILELGAGIGRGSVYLHNVLGLKSSEFFLVDGDSGDAQVAGIHDKLKPDYYNSFDAAVSYCTANGIDRDRLHLVDANAIEDLGNVKFDLCFSIKSIGFHWPINEYLHMLHKNLRKGALLVFEIRNPDLYAPDRRNRLSRFVNKQTEAIDPAEYQISAFHASKFHMLVLKKL